MNFLRNLFGKVNNTKVSKGDIVKKTRHYDFKNNQAVIIDGPDEAYKGTKWRVIKIGKTPSKLTPPPGYRIEGGVLGEQNYVELELIEGEYKIKQMDFSDVSHPGFKIEIFRPGHRIKINNSRYYEEYFPDSDQLQQFYDEWETVIKSK
jgi:hypothetical protein